MPNDLQIIDGFERLREAYRGAGGHPAPAPAQHEAPEARVVEAWLQAVEGRVAAAGQALRRVRLLARAVLEEADLAGEPRLAPLAPRVREGIDRARRAGLAPLAERPAQRSLAEEAVQWRRALPGLGGQKAWRMLERLGRPAVVPSAALRRFLWRYGLIEDEAAARDANVAIQAIFERIGEQTSMPVAELHPLARWLTGGRREVPSGAWCAGRPRCPECPLRPGCPYARFRKAHEPEPGREGMVETLRQRVAAGEFDQLAEVELIAALLAPGAGGGEALAIAQALLERFTDLRGLERATVEELAQARGVSRGRAVQLKAALELGRRFATRGLQPGDPITCSEDVWRAYRARFRNLPQEHFSILLLDSKNRVIRDQIVSKGTLNGSMAHPREVFQAAVRQSASAVILMHNHPSGDPHPSAEDREVTRRLRDAGEILGIRVLDHIILGADDFYSFRDNDEMTGRK